MYMYDFILSRGRLINVCIYLYNLYILCRTCQYPRKYETCGAKLCVIEIGK